MGCRQRVVQFQFSVQLQGSKAVGEGKRVGENEETVMVLCIIDSQVKQFQKLPCSGNWIQLLLPQFIYSFLYLADKHQCQYSYFSDICLPGVAEALSGQGLLFRNVFPVPNKLQVLKILELN